MVQRFLVIGSRKREREREMDSLVGFEVVFITNNIFTIYARSHDGRYPCLGRTLGATI